MRRSLVIATLLLAIAFVFVGGPSLLTSPTADDVAPEDEPDPEIIRPEGSESGFWPYLNSQKSFQKRSPINFVVRGDTDQIVRYLSEDSGGNWTETDEEHEEADSDTHSVRPANESAENETGANNSTVNATGENDTRANEFEENKLTTLEFGENNSTANETGVNETTNETGTNETGGSTGRNEPTANGARTNDSANDTVEIGSAVNETDENNSTNETSENGSISIPTEIEWGRTTGATRYAYVKPSEDAEGQWVTETIQLHDGSYYGQRYHIRLYESPNPDDRWVAMQTHTEHFDWFTLRHRVDGAEAAQTRLEKDFMAMPQVDEREDVRRMYLENGGPSDTNGWATVVELVSIALAFLVVGATAGRNLFERVNDAITSHLTDADRRRLEETYDRIEVRHLILIATILVLLLGVRFAGIALERNADFLSMHAIAALLYPFIGLGIPIATYLIASGLERRLDAAVAASLGMAAAIWLDYGLLGVDSLPVDVVLQRMLIVVAIGLIAGGAALRATRDSRWNDMLVVGATMWILVLMGTLFGYL